MIRVATASDLLHLQGIEQAADTLLVERFGATGWPSPPSGAERAASPGFVLTAVADTGEPVGFAHVLEIEGLAHLEQVSVHPRHGRRGIGGALVEAAQRRARAHGHARLTLRTFADVPWNARLGFAESAPTGRSSSSWSSSKSGSGSPGTGAASR